MKQKKLRTCGECTACCTTHAVHSIKKPAGKLCRFCNEGVGCKTYSTRPQGCQDFTCDWLKGDLKNSSRPDICGIVFQTQKWDGLPNGGIVLVAFEYLQESLENFRSSGLIEEMLAEKKFAAFVHLSGRGQFYAPIGLQVTEVALEYLGRKNSEVVYLPITQAS